MTFHDWMLAFTWFHGGCRAVDLRNRDDVAGYFVRNPDDDMAVYYARRFAKAQRERSRRAANEQARRDRQSVS
jgi:hypothetical protein